MQSKFICNKCHEFVTEFVPEFSSIISECCLCGDMESGKYITEQTTVDWFSEEYTRKITKTESR